MIRGKVTTKGSKLRGALVQRSNFDTVSSTLTSCSESDCFSSASEFEVLEGRFWDQKVNQSDSESESDVSPPIPINHKFRKNHVVKENMYKAKAKAKVKRKRPNRATFPMARSETDSDSDSEIEPLPRISLHRTAFLLLGRGDVRNPSGSRSRGPSRNLLRP